VPTVALVQGAVAGPNGGGPDHAGNPAEIAVAGGDSDVRAGIRNQSQLHRERWQTFDQASRRHPERKERV